MQFFHNDSICPSNVLQYDMKRVTIMTTAAQMQQLDEGIARDLFYHDKCDKYDYLLAVGCGAVAGLVDIFMVGSPASSCTQAWTDTQVDHAVMAFARKMEWTPRAGNETNVASAIGFLEKKFPVNYDQANGAAVGNLFAMGTKNHHLKSLAHSPDIVGLFFSILNQFTSTSTFLNDGQLITIATNQFELHGHDFVSKLFCGVANWFGHIMSDVAGSSGASGRGSGVAIPFFEMFQLCDFGQFQAGQYRNTLATIATKVFQEGYDLRFGLTMSIPVVLCDLSIKLIWALKHYFYHKRPLTECIPTKRHDDLRLMLLLGSGTLCAMDGIDAAARSGGNAVLFFLHFNIIAWCRFAFLIIREVCIQLKMKNPIQQQLESYKRVHAALTGYLKELQAIDIDRFERETAQYNHLIAELRASQSETDLTQLLESEYECLGITRPWQGDFDEFMGDRNNKLVFS